MDITIILNRITARVLLFLVFASLKLLSLEKLAILFLPFILVNDTTSFLLNIGLIPVAAFLLVIVALIKFMMIVKDKLSLLLQ
ncbi:hypothetical protein [Stygiolobus caldivivus]|uniref:hypothetical protein n=1 Tax=Stygiolobus caldivivus TaxID=2824673 RepID=UPI001C8596CB|nr:hypothetical protein [Stygiolobus caldivivus]